MLSMGRGCQIALHKATVAHYFEAHQHCKWELLYISYSFRFLIPYSFWYSTCNWWRVWNILFQCPFVTHSWYYSFGSDLGSLSLFLPFPLLGALFNGICQDTFSFLHLIVCNCCMFTNVHIPFWKGRMFTLITLIIY